ncbi:MAG: 2-oxoacid:acceptor oxidoreductase subunit alpha [Alphaproteobacteria bacterium]|nr:2-oxoacid:acceptor oxidoreductase subunit alpha [Alphaproteobacteria bacterium]
MDSANRNPGPPAPDAAAADSTLSLAIVGSGGSGVMTTGAMLLDAAARAGRYGLLTRSVGPQIRGGEAVAMVRLGAAPLACNGDTCDILLALDWQNAERFAAELALGPHSLVIAEESAGDMPPALQAPGARIVKVPLQKTAKAIKGRPNMVALGLAAAMAGLPQAAVTGAVARVLGGKGAATLAASEAAVAAGYGEASRLGAPAATAHSDERPRWIITGNEAAGLGAVRAGVRFAAAYPITPATEIMEWLADALPKVGGALVQAEDELASINMTIGAAYGGTPSMTATSGPGLALMVESIGLAITSEIPLLVVDVMRSGPSTGIPTKSEQSDLNIAIHGVHGDAPHLVLAPLSVADCLFTTQWAAHLAERLQAPAIVLSDQYLGQTRMVIDRPAEGGPAARRVLASATDGSRYARYALTPSGVSPMSVPGMASRQYTADGLEHSQHGTPSSKAEDHLAQLEKRRNKLAGYDYGDAWAEIDGDGDLAVVTWGSTAGPVREAVARARRRGLSVRVIALRLLSPLSPSRLAAALDGARGVLVVEQNHSGQFHRLLRAHAALPADTVALHRPGPIPFRPGEIVSALERWM